MEKKLLIKKVLAKLKSNDLKFIVDYVKRNINKPEELIGYFDSYTKRNKLEPYDKIQIIRKLQDEKIDLKNYPWNKIVKEFRVHF